jgi:hypothetical protein
MTLGILLNATTPVKARLMVLAAFGYIVMLAFAWLFIAWRVIYERYRRPAEDGHTRAADREEHWYPLK